MPENDSDRDALPRQVSRVASLLTTFLWFIATTGVIGAFVGVLFPVWNEWHQQRSKVSEFLESASSAGMSNAYQSKVWTEPGSAADRYTTVLIELWSASYSSLDKPYSEPIGADGRWHELSLWGNRYEFCYPILSSLPSAKCVQLDHFRFSEQGYIESFTIDDTPVSSLIAVWPESTDEVDLVWDGQDDDSPFRVYRRARLIEPDFSHSYLSFEIRYAKSPDAQHRFLKIIQDPKVEDRKENSLIDAHATLPDYVHRFAPARGALSFSTTGKGFVFMCVKYATKEEREANDSLEGQNPRCEWVSFS